MKAPSQFPQRWNPPARQRGMVATLVAIIVLVATLIAAAALVISVDTSNVVAGNIAFRQALIQESERAYAQILTETGMLGLDNVPSYTNQPALGYYAAILPAIARPDLPDMLTANPPAGGVVMPASGSGNTVTYVLERLCTVAGAPTLATCQVPGATIISGTGANAKGDSGNLNFLSGLPVAYRLSVRVDGPRNSISYMQTVLR